MKRLFSLVFLGCVGWMTAHSQTASLSGTVTDRQTGEPLPGASIELTLKGGSGAGNPGTAGRGPAASGSPNGSPGKKDIHLLAGLNGSFLVRHITAGHYEVSVKFVGYERYAEEMDLAEGTAKTLQVILESKKSELTAVSIVSGARGTERASQLVDRRADIVQNSLSARSIEISPDLSVANAAQHISGVSLERSSNGEGQYVIIRGMEKRYIYTLVNGVKIPSPDNKNRYVPLDLFPADMLERLEIFKSLTPNMEGDAIGGAVNMVMKDAPSKFSVNANAALGYANSFFTQDYTKFDPGPSLNRSPRDLNGPTYDASMKDFPNNAFSHSASHNPLGSVLGLSVGGRLFGDKLGILVAGSFQNNYRNANSVFFGTQTSMQDGSAQLTSVETRNYSIQQQRSGVHARLDYHLNEKNKISLYGAYLNLMRQEFRYASDTNLELHRIGPGYGRVSNSYRDLYDVQQIAHATLKGQHTLASNFFLDWTAAYSKATLNRPDEATLGVNGGVDPDPVTGAKVVEPPTVNGASREFTHSTDEDKSGYANLLYRSQIGDAKVDWSAGGMYRDKHRTSSYDNYDIRPDPGGQLYNGDISQNTFIVYNTLGTSDDALNYQAGEKVGAAYAMVKIDWNKFLITGGARYEHTDLTWNTNVPKEANGKTGSIIYYDVLPSGSIKYALGKKQALRLSYYSAVSRPNFYEVIPHYGGEPDADYTEIGNSHLKRTTADNFDLRYEYFPKGLDQLLVGVFYKNLKNPIEYALKDSGTNTYYLPENFGNATNYGAELDLTKYWRWFGVKLNYTYTHSSITTSKQLNYSIPGGTSSKQVDQTRPLQGQSKHIGNLSLLFKDDNKLGLNAQLVFAYTSRRINTVSQFLNNDIWQKDFEQLDFAVEKKLSHRWYIYAKVNNILNTPYELEILQPYLSSGAANSAPYQTVGKNTFVRKDTYGANYLLGVKFKM
ncbi:MAG TPA: TonB-dependent receptor [Puia sp.]|nr:TonB-dependent receptor [Puia sp.]